jgi:hypothetical protein
MRITKQAIGDGSSDVWRHSQLFLDLREVSRTTVAVRVRPEHAEQVWELLHLIDSSMKPLAKKTRRAIEYLTKDDGLPYLDGDWDYLEIRTRGTLKRVTKQLAGFFMLTAERIHNENKA